ncbi:bacteriocin-like protein [Chryseobacterium sp. YIM B08800]|uniref:bacteriocin-like protein n=1 Tax=Chryseobacterium sp. YIM B08800 TaxID=2984136 RepID=UPI003A0FD215
MKNLKKLTREQLRSVSGSGMSCPAEPAAYCGQWCTMNSWQQRNCPIEFDPSSCDCLCLIGGICPEYY